MIMLNVADYCNNCDQFSPAIETNVFYGDGTVYSRDTTVFCKNKERCQSIHDAIIKSLEKTKEE